MDEQRPHFHFDHHSPEFAQEPWSIYREMRQQCPVAHSDAYGGFWALSTYEHVRRVALDDDTFSSASSIVIPPKLRDSRPAIPIEVDPPLFLEYRALLNPLLSPAAVAEKEPTLQRLITACIDEFVERGEADLIEDLADPLPAMATLDLLGLPVDDWHDYADPLHVIAFVRQDNEARQTAMREYREIQERLADEVRARREAPRDDMISRLLEGTVDGRPVTDEEVLDMVETVLQGGMDTTGAAISNALLYLDEDREARERLIAEPDLMPHAVEEFLRYEAPQQALARTTTAECEVGGHTLEEGEKVLLLWASANRDEEVFPDAEQCIIDRFPNRHVTFGVGAHRCLGSTFARTQMRLALEAVLERLPDYEVQRDGVVRAETIGLVYRRMHIPITFTPGSRLGTG